MKDMKIKDIVMKVIDVLYNIIVGVLTILGKVVVFLIALIQSNSIAKSKSAVKFIFSDSEVKTNVNPKPIVDPTSDIDFEIVEPKQID